MTRPLVIIGCGGFGREVHDVVDAINGISPTWDLLGYLDDAPAMENVTLVEGRGYRVLGGSNWLTNGKQDVSYVIGIGTGSVRRMLDGRLTALGLKPATLIHPAATLGYGVTLGRGSIICAGARLTTNIHLGRHVHININSTIGHDTVLHDYVTVNPLVAVSGWVEVGAESMLGTHSAILQNLKVGQGSVVGAGSCVVKPVPSGVTVKGVPAR
jgi:sugar O-acyltransferase (sialic acid O-acetyltransferase NeuD family)